MHVFDGFTAVQVLSLANVFGDVGCIGYRGVFAYMGNMCLKVRC